MEQMFFKGDTVVCRSGSDLYGLVKGQRYIVKGVEHNHIAGDRVRVKGINRWLSTTRFDHVVINEVSVPKTQEVQDKITPRNKYSREIKPEVFIDVYDVLRAFDVTDPCLSHLTKKALCAGLRGHKDRLEDLKDIKASVERAIEIHLEWENEDK